MRHQKTLVAAALASSMGIGVGGYSLAANESNPAATRSGDAAGEQHKSMRITSDELLEGSVITAAGEDVGNVQAVVVDRNGHVRSLVVGVGGFLGLGQRDVGLNWDQVDLTEAGNVVALDMTREELEALPEYEYPEGAGRGMAFYGGGEDAEMVAAGGDMPAGTAADDPGMAGSPAQDMPGAIGSAAGAEPTGAGDVPVRSDRAAMETEQPGWTSAPGPDGAIRASDFVGTEIMNADQESIGEVAEILIQEDNQLQAVVSVGGFLGVGEHHALLDWNELNIERQNDRIRVTTTMTREEIEALPQL